ncbi:MAG TPA: transcription antitermination factor NusB [Actinomycetota bacterium]|nr:transcription antitermination factor NusB [Actinomycetota bacterium]
MTSRRQARRAAIQILYQADVTGTEPRAVLLERAMMEPVAEFAQQLVEGVDGILPQVDQILEEHAEGWRVSRMPAVDRSILRVAVYELLARPDVPRAAAINEAVEAANELSTEDSGRFVNGVLGRIAREMPPPEAEPT